MPLNLRRASLGLVIGLGGHLLAFAAGFIAGRVVQPSEGGGFEDVAAVALLFLGVEVLVGLASLIGGVVLAAKGKRDLGLGVIVGWLIGIAGLLIFFAGEGG